MYTNEINEKLGKLQDLLADQDTLHYKIISKKKFIEDEMHQLADMRKQAQSNTDEINYLLKDLGRQPLTEIEGENTEKTISINELYPTNTRL